MLTSRYSNGRELYMGTQHSAHSTRREHVAKLSKQNVALKRFGQKAGLSVHEMGLPEARIARHVHHFHLRPDRNQLLSQGTSIHSRHYDIGQKQVYGTLVLARCL